MTPGPRRLVALFFSVAAVFMIIGCSGENPLTTRTDEVNSLSSDGDGSDVTSGEQIQIAGRVAAIDYAQEIMNLVGQSYTVFPAEDCAIVRLEGGEEIPITFGDIQIGDSLRVCGMLQENDYLCAHRIRVYSETECDNYDVAFGGTIETIDYAAGTFTVSERPETIVVDENTVIWTRISHRHGISAGAVEPSVYTPPDNHIKYARDTILAFTDLQVGDQVEVKANIVDAATLLAVSVKLAGANFTGCVEFADYLASVDCPTRIVTFETNGWIGVVCPGAVLTGADGEPLTLADFAAADYVSVKGFPLSEDTLKVSQMTRE